MFMDKLINLQNVGPGRVAVLNCPVGATYDKIKFELGGGLTAADITMIEGKADGRRFFIDTGPNIVKRQAYKGIFTAAGFLTLDFTEPKTRGGAAMQYLASIPSNLLKQLTFEITIAGGANALSTLTAHAEARPPTNNPYIRKQLDFSQSFAAAGEQSLFLPTGTAGGIIKRLWLHCSLLDSVDLRVNRVSVMRATKAQWEYAQKENEMVPQAAMSVIDFIVDGNIQGALNTQAGSEIELRLNLSGAETVKGYLEYIDPIARL